MDDLEDAAPACCVCLEELDYNGSVMVQCAQCAMRVHVKCYGVAVSPGASDAGTWLCEPCAFMQGKPSPTGTPWPAAAGDGAQRMQPYCAICPTAGGALRQTDQPGVWSHVLCINWIPELSHSMTGALNERVQISLLDRSRETLRCLICGQRGGCIQCVSGRCARAFHVMCAFRAPSTVVFTGYNGDNQQIYHCKTHLGDVTTRKFEMVERSWRQLPQVQAFLQASPSAADGRCRVCQGKAASGAASQQSPSDHEAQCLLAWLVRDDLRRRKEQMDALGVKPVEISYANSKHKPKSNGSGSRRASDAGANAAHGSGAGKKRQPVPMRPCPECGESIRESLLSTHLKNRCAQTHESSGGNSKRSKNPRRKSSGQARNVVDLTASDFAAQQQQGGDLADVVFASWPGQSAGNRMDATHLWKTLNHHFFTNRTFVQRRMEQLCKNVCGCKLDELCSVSQQALMHKTSLQCSDTSLFERRPEDPLAPLVLQSTLHRCDNIVRKSRMRCMDDIFAKPCLEIAHDPVARNPSASPENGHSEPSNEVKEDAAHLYGDVRVQFTNKDEQTSMDCRVAMYLSHGEQQPPALDDGAVWSRFSHDAVCTLVGSAVEATKVPLESKSSELWVSLRKCEDVQDPVQKPDSTQDGAVPQPDELTPSINLLMDQLKEQTKANRYRLRANCQKLQLHEAAQVRAVRVSAITESYFREFASWKRLCLSLVVGYRDVLIPLVKPETTAGTPSSSPKNGQSEDPEAEDQEPVDDGTCVVCFDGQSPESNPIIFCDRCDLAVHQRCYGVVDVPANEFYCDRCLVETVNRDSVAASTPSSVFCQLCSLPDGAFKQTIDGKWVHVVCALWCPNVWIGNLQDLSEISLVGGTQDTRFLDTLAEVEARVALSPTATKPKSPTKVVGTPLQRGSLCLHCRVACGRTIRCCHEGCDVSYHALCGWFDGLPMVMELSEHGFVYGGGGAGLKFQLHCPQHLPEGYSLAERSVQSRRRNRFRIDAFAVASQQGKPENTTSASPKADGQKPEGFISTRSSKQNDSETPTDAKDWTDMFSCGACFEHSSPVVDDLPRVDTLTRRQFLVRCQSCSTFVHPECAITDLGSPQEIFSNNWICERCVMARDKPHVACIVCEKSTDYLMPCGDPSPPSINTTASKANGHASLISKLLPPSPNSQNLPALMQQQLQQQQQLLNAHAYHSAAPAPVQVHAPVPAPVPTRSPSVYDEWIHVFCCKWTKAKTIRRQRILCANPPKGIDQGLATRCELCSTRGVRLLIVFLAAKSSNC